MVAQTLFFNTWWEQKEKRKYKERKKKGKKKNLEAVSHQLKPLCGGGFGEGEKAGGGEVTSW